MVMSRRAGYALLVLGVVLGIAPFVLGGGTALACDIDSVIYNTIGIYPAEYAVTGVDLSSLELFWSDGCNSRTSSLVPFFVGVGSLLMGLAITKRSTSSVRQLQPGRRLR